MRSKIPCFIISYYRPSFLEKCIDSLRDERLELVIVSNDGEKYFPKEDDPPLAQLLMSKNCLHDVCWSQGIVPFDRPYIVTDCDIVAPDNDWLDVLLQGMMRLPQYNKFGLGLDTNIPDTYPEKEAVLKHEQEIYRKKVDSLFEEAPVDTTLALYRQGYLKYSLWGNNSPIQYNGECRSVRTISPEYKAKHLTWYMTPEDLAGEEHTNYQKKIDKRITNWSKTL